MDLREYLKVIKRRKIIIIATTIFIFFSYWIIAIRQPQVYRASSSIMLTELTVAERVLRSLSSVSPISVSLGTQIQLMESRYFAERIVERLKNNEHFSLTTNEIMASRSISQVGKTNVIQINVQSLDKDKAVAIARAYAELAVEENQNIARSEFTKAREFIQTQLRRYQERMKRAEEALREFNRRENVVDFDTTLTSKVGQLTQFQIDVQQARMQLAQQELFINQLRNRLKTTKERQETTNVIPNPLRRDLKRQIFTLEADLIELKERYTDTHPKVIALENKIAKLQKKLETQVSRYVTIPTVETNPLHTYFTQQLANQEMNLMGIKIREDSIKKLISQTEQQLTKLSQKHLEYARLLREVKTTERMYNSLIDMYEQMRVSEVTKLGNAKKVDVPKSAYPTRGTDWQKMVLMLIISIMGGISLGVVLEFIDDTVKTGHDVRRYLNLPVLGSIPRIVEEKNRLLTSADLKSPIAEAYHKLCFQLESACLDMQARMLLLTSSRSEEGKTTVLANIAISLAREGERVLLADGDVRRPHLHRLFGISNTMGLTTLLSGEIIRDEEGEDKDLSTLIDKFIRPTEIERLSILPSGPSVSNPVELLRSERMKEVISILRQKADFILFDSSPVIAVIDPVIIASHLDAVILLLDASQIKRREALQGKQLLTNLKIKIIGTVLNNISMEEEDYYYYYYYSGYGPRVRRKKSRKTTV